MKEFLDKIPVMDIKELDRVSEEIFRVSGSIARLEKKYNFKISNKNIESLKFINTKDQELLHKSLSRIKKISEDLDYIFLED